MQFVDTQWNDEYAYTSRDIADLLGLNPRVARYYLISMIKKGKLAQIKYSGRTYYIKPHQVEWFVEFKEIGLEIW